MWISLMSSGSFCNGEGNAACGGAAAAAGAVALGINRRLLLSGKCRRQSVFFRICQFILDSGQNQFMQLTGNPQVVQAHLRSHGGI